MSETPRDPQPETDDRQADEDTSDQPDKDEVQERSEESFPASDPPSF